MDAGVSIFAPMGFRSGPRPTIGMSHRPSFVILMMLGGFASGGALIATRDRSSPRSRPSLYPT